ncbi:MAG: hypothetical protein KDG55_03005 [Rhodocyclaceae bacterium]|nr:hypothetical protein [Rhodocyclaceae bacterium]
MDRQEQGEDFSLLVDDLRRREKAGQPDAVPAPVSVQSRTRRTLLLALGGWGLAALLAQLTLGQRSPAAAEIRSDLIQLLERSRAAVESGRTRDGRLPELLPDPTCARLVTYTVNGGGDAYELRAGFAGMTMTWNSLLPGRFEEYLW